MATICRWAQYCDSQNSLWRCSVEVKVVKVDEDSLVLEGDEGVGALHHVLLGVQVDGGHEGAVLRQGARR